MPQRPLLSQALRITHSLWLRVLAVYFFTHVTILGSFGLGTFITGPDPIPALRWFDRSLCLLLAFLFVVWTWGRIAEIASGEAPAPRWDNFTKACRQFWGIAVVVALTPIAVHFIMWIIGHGNTIPLNLIAAPLDVVLSFWAAQRVMSCRYAALAGGRFTEPRPSWPLMGLMPALPLLAFAIAIGARQLEGSPWLSPLPGLLLVQLNFLAFSIYTLAGLEANPAVERHFTRGKHLILVNLSSGGIIIEAFSAFLRLYPPFFSVLRALTPSDYHVTEFNRLLWRDRYVRAPALVAISCFTANCAEAYLIARRFRDRGAHVVMGGPHVSFFPQEALEYCDSVVIGEAESVWEDIIRDHESGRLQPVYRGHFSPQGQQKVHEHLMRLPDGIAADFLQNSRGCKFNCYFCAIRALAGDHRHKRSLAQMIDLVSKVTRNRRKVAFIDNNIYADPDYAKEFFRALIPLKIHWVANASIDIAEDNEALRLLGESGCQELLIGYEVAEGSNSAGSSGKFRMAGDYLALSRRLQQAGIRIKAHFIFGFPGDTWQTLARMWWFCFRLSPLASAISYLTPLPGSRFFADTVREEGISNLNWRCWDISQQVSIHPRLYPSRLLQKGFMAILMLFFLTTSTMGRWCLLLIIVFGVIFMSPG